MHALCYSIRTDQSRRGAHTAAQKVVALDHALLIPRLIVVQTTRAQGAQDMRGGGLILERAQDEQVALRHDVTRHHQLRLAVRRQHTLNGACACRDNMWSSTGRHSP